jgi:hypothetical protein
MRGVKTLHGIGLPELVDSSIQCLPSHRRGFLRRMTDRRWIYMVCGKYPLA